MRLKEGLVLREVAGEHIVIATGELAKTHKHMVVLNESGAVLWGMMQEDFTPEDIERRTLEHYQDAKPDTVREDVREFLEFLQLNRLLEYNLPATNEPADSRRA